MKKIRSFIIVFLLTVGTVNTFGQNKSYPFEVKISGQGKQSIIFIPGFTCSGEVWNETKSVYEKDFTCYTLTMAGFAEVKPQPNASFKNWEDGIVNFIKDNKIKKPILIGHSMGGGLTLAIASDYPKLIKKIIVVDAVPCMGAFGNPAFKSLENPDNSEKINSILSATDEQFRTMQKNSIYGLVTNKSKQELVLSWALKSDRKTLAEMFWDYANIDLREKLKNITCPSLILLNSYYSKSKPVMEEQFKNLKNVNLQYAGKGSHFIMYDDTEWYLSQLNNFIPKK
ncbi:alpha/beta fold hydrolase [Flavobacterium collinsii]|uniref:2-succinyl-6-hydroxy-2, 4-cyclohexadiene-1-carboxylate synthase n=1 Tax=Flavobacterium collinsii TaxID=1114861 RepID=A0ABM8KM42_9FLAO|nr:alpha/beta hydrolase [Flavobacterium collinsii]CAA9200969.1 2-succinyl-6-hydroxy-2, 4-cyclohexadiene-1-carboxylate synthase [Flavobacterium collinsii]